MNNYSRNTQSRIGAFVRNAQKGNIEKGTVRKTHTQCVAWLVCCLVSSVAAAQDLPTVPTQPKQTRDSVISEIEQIRKQIGGGVAESLSGLIPVEDSNREFADELRKQEQLRKQEMIRQTEKELPRIPAPSSRLFPREVFMQGKKPPQRSLLSGKQQEVQLTRRAARRLEEMAAEFEEAGIYDSADELRAQAAKFWLKARSSDQKTKTLTQVLQPTNVGPASTK